MSEFVQNINVNSLYVCLLVVIYSIWNTNYYYINIVLEKLYLFNYMSLLVIINIIGLYLFLKHVSFEINIKCAMKYK